MGFSSGLLDNQSTIHLAKDHMYHKRTKHIDVMYHRIRQWAVRLLTCKDQYEKESSRHDDKDHPNEEVHPSGEVYPGGEVQNISELHQCSPKIGWRISS